ASARDTLWKVALCGGIVSARGQPCAPVGRFVPSAEAVRVTFDAAAVESVAPAFTPRALEAAASPALPSLSVSVLLLSLWLLVTFALLVRIAIGHGRFLSVVGDRVEIVTGPERARLEL